ncbi:hypothetical protein IAD21_00247 [Abditibacteriota bacterium]|nr:hypothetical protein IAD21_00247 [Abditibacteriota bacterium]
MRTRGYLFLLYEGIFLPLSKFRGYIRASRTLRTSSFPRFLLVLNSSKQFHIERAIVDGLGHVVHLNRWKLNPGVQ